MPAPHAPELQQPPKNSFSAEDLVRAEALLRAQDLLRGLVDLSPSQPAPLAEAPTETITPEPTMTPSLPAPRAERQPITPRPPSRTAVRTGGIALRPPTKSNLIILGAPPATPTADTQLSYADAMPEFADLQDGDWQELALCSQVDPEIFFPEKGGSTREAKKICQSCEVRAECLEQALATQERFGIWGGFSERERRRMTRSAARIVSAEVDSVLSTQPYTRVKQLIELLEGAPDENREVIENSLHEDEGRLTKFVQATLGWYRQERPKATTKGALNRLFNYFNGANLEVICENASVSARLRKEIQAMMGFFDEICDEGGNPLQECWERSQPNDSALQVTSIVSAKPKWVKDAMLAERRAAAN